MNEEAMKKYILSGKINSDAKRYARKIIKPGSSLLEIAEKIEEFIKNKGGKPAFPVNLSLNNTAAHYTPEKNDATTMTEKDLLKVDIGIHIDGYISDSAFSLCFDSTHNDLIKASEKALSEAVKISVPGTKIGEIGKTIHDTITSFGFKPVSNLTGHGLGRYDVHAKYSIPNIPVNSNKTLEENDIIAIEPFATDGCGKIKESGHSSIYSLVSPKPVRSVYGRKLLKDIEEYKTLPFAKRWINMNEHILEKTLNDLERQNILRSYPVLKEIDGSFVSQSEHTVIVKDNPVVITK